MRAKPVLAAMLATAVGAYGAWPYVTLYRLDHALHSGDAATLQSLVDWPAVREGIKEDICDSVAANPETTAGDGKLPEFGASFARGIAANEVDQRVTAEGLVRATQTGLSGTSDRSTLQLSRAFFESPTGFVVNLTAPGKSDHIRVEMTLKDGAWVVTRIWLPQALLEEANAGT